MDPEYKKNTAKSYYALARVLILFPFFMIVGSFGGRYIQEKFGLHHPLYFLLSIVIVSVIGWGYVIFEYKKIKSSWKK
ncbi:MAG: hypothetical protein KBD15_04290 [Candidatus Magasanikbacteria bacterium]|jgi:phosphate starvation-inducible membrane PsiE|nr:hypothetical protein [Candidatus Magasanikbacteria bacterium]